MRASSCALSLLLVGVGVYASHYLSKFPRSTNKGRERKLWMVITILLVATFVQLGYDSYLQAVKPNTYCIGLLPVRTMQNRDGTGNAIIWLFSKLICCFSVDFTCIRTFWPKKKVVSPLLKPADNEDLAIRTIVGNIHFKNSVTSNISSISLTENEYSTEQAVHIVPTLN